MKRSSNLCLQICLTAMLLWLASVSDSRAIFGGEIMGSHSWYHYPGQFIWNGYNVYNGADFNVPNHRITILVDAGTPNGSYTINFWHLVRYSSPKITFDVNSGVVTNRVDQDFTADVGGAWSMEVSGPQIAQRYKDPVITYWLYSPEVWSYRYGPKDDNGVPVLTASDQTVGLAAIIPVVIDLRANRSIPDPDLPCPCPGTGDSPFVASPEPPKAGMAQATLNQNYPGIQLTDLPLTYRPAYGPAPSFRLTYSDISPTLLPSGATAGSVTPPRHSNTQQQSPFSSDNPAQMEKIVDDLINPATPADALATHLGSGWGLGLLSFVKGGVADRTYSSNPNPEAFYYEPGYGKERYNYYNFASGGQIPAGGFLPNVIVYPPQNRSRAQLTYKLSTGAYERLLPDGSKQVFGKTVTNSDGHKYLFITKQIDPQGNTLTYTYYGSSSFARLTGITDATGKVTQFFYQDGSNPQRLTKITDPFGRSVLFAYDGDERLESITDPVGVVSEFTYNADGRVTQLTTPYGDTTFERDFVAGWRMAQMTLPDGSKERTEFFNRVNSSLTPLGGAPSGSGLTVTQSNLEQDVSFYWSRKAMAVAAAASQAPLSNGSYPYASQTQWVKTGLRSMNVPASIKPYGENRIWMNYKNGAGATFQQFNADENAVFAPSAVARLTETGSEISRAVYNTLGKPTSIKDPGNRETTFTYSASGIDLLNIKQVVSGTPQTLASFTYNALTPHLPVTRTDAANKTTAVSYNSKGQPVSITNAKSETTTLAYNAEGYLEKITRPLGNITSLTWDKGMPRTMTDSQGLTITTAYDKLDRLLRRSWPDGTSEVGTYDKLDPKTFKDRSNRVTTWVYNNLRQKESETDPEGRETLFEWCRCGALQKLTDAAGNITQWSYDAGARLLSKTYPDTKQDTYTYYSASGRLYTATDAASRVKTYTYKLDGRLDVVSYTGDSNLTPDVTFSYDSYFPRVTSMVDGSGTTSYTYRSVGSTGALQVDTESKTGVSGFSSYSLGFTYDDLGRVTAQSLDSNSRSVTYDAMGRISAWTNSLGTFGATYVTGTGKLDTITYPNGQTTTYSYHDNNVKGEDFRLAGILNETSGSSLLSSNSYIYNPTGSIKSWTQTAGAAAAQKWEFGYDKADQLLSGTLALAASPYTISSQQSFRYDAAGNRLSEQIGSGVKESTYNNLNQVTGVDGGGWMRFKGQTNEAAYVRVKSDVDNTYVPATNEAGNAFNAVVPVANGSTITVEATDTSPNSNVSTKQYTVGVDALTPRTLTYDFAGNMTSDGSKAYTWDAENRLVKILYSDSTSTEFSYDGRSRRVKTLEKNSGGTVTSEKRFIWSGSNQPVEERNSSNVVTIRYFEDGEQTPAASSPADKLFYTKDHLGSVRELTDDDEVVRARYAYDLWGNTTKLSGDLGTVVGYTGHHLHSKSALYQTMYRFYDPQLGRWLSRDPIAENGGINLYGYVGNDPINGWDPLGLLTVHYWAPSAGGYGHLSMTLNDGTYISNWPEDGQKHPFGGGDTRTPDYSADRNEECADPTNLVINGLDENAIKDWWTNRDRANGYTGLGSNCSQVVAEGLTQGGLKNLAKEMIYDPEDTWNNINRAVRPPAPKPNRNPPGSISSRSGGGGRGR